MVKKIIFLFFIAFYSQIILAQNEFITKWDLSEPGSATTSITFGVGTTGTVNYTWEEVGNPSNNGSGTFSSTPAMISNLPAGATILLKIAPTNFNYITMFSYIDKPRLLEVRQWGTVTWSSFNISFRGCSNLDIIAADKPDLSTVTDLSDMFSGCSKLIGPSNIGMWNTSTINSMGGMFSGCSLFNQNIGNWDVSNVKNMAGMFANAILFNQNLGSWNLKSLINNGLLGNSMEGTLSNSGMDCFNYSKSLIGWASNPNTANGVWLGATGIQYSPIANAARAILVSKGWAIFTGDILDNTCTYSEPNSFITEWDLTKPGSSAGTISMGVGLVTGGTGYYSWEEIGGSGARSGTFTGTSLTISGLPNHVRLRIDSTNFRRIEFFINGGYRERLVDVEQWGTVHWASMADAFFACKNLNISASDIPDLSNVTSMNRMFLGCTSLTGHSTINLWNTSNSRGMIGLFDNATLFNQDIGMWNTSNVISMQEMFRGASQFNQDLSLWDTKNVGSMKSMFSQATSFNQNLGTWNLNSLGLASMMGMLNQSGLSCTNYSNTLIGWASNSNTPVINTNLEASGLKYNPSALPSRNILSSTKHWLIQFDAINPIWYLDQDGDGYHSASQESCSSPGSGWTQTPSLGSDCNDNYTTINPGATEICNTIDDDCDGQVDEGVTITFYRDSDGDTYGDLSATAQACSVPPGYVSNNTDCNDNAPNSNPAATEICDNLDNDCDGSIDEGNVCNQSPIAICQNITVTMNTNDCKANVSSDQVNNGSTDPEGSLLSFSLTPAGPYAIGTTGVILTVIDPLGASATCSAAITVTGITLDASASSNPVAVGTAANLAATISSAVSGIIVTFTLDNGNGGMYTSTGNSNVSGIATASIASLPVELYKVTVTAGSGCATAIAYIPVYDPNGGFITGGGWIQSPAGAYVADPLLTGKANFGYVAKYKNGNNQVDGNTEFQFKAGNFNFKSTLHESGTLVISGAKASYRGVGTVNGSGSYSFLLSAVDGQVNGGGGSDKFRIKIWNKNNGNGLVYDNQMNGPDHADATTVLGGGSIVIHKGNNNIVGNILESRSVENLQITSWPNPTKDKVNLMIIDTNPKHVFKLYTIQGKLLSTRTSYSEYETIDLHAYPDGAYILQLQNELSNKSIKLVKAE